MSESTKIFLQRAAFACIAVLVCFHSALFAQVGGIRGVVADPSGAVIPGVNVTVTNTASGVSERVTTNESGVYVVPFLNPGMYKVEAAKPGFSTVTRDKLKLDVE